MNPMPGWLRDVVGAALREEARAEVSLGATRRDDFGPLPPALRGAAPRWAQEHGIQQTYLQLQNWFGNMPVLVDKARRRNGMTVSPLRPDLQYDNPNRRGRPTHVEVDSDPRRMADHIRARDRNTRSVFLLVDPNTGALQSKRVYPARGSGTHYVRNARPGRPLTLTRRDFFTQIDV